MTVPDGIISDDLIDSYNLFSEKTLVEDARIP